MEGLKPCPFCGGPGRLSECGYQGDSIRIHCSTDWGHCVSFIENHNSPDARARLVKRWNTRPTEKECSICDLAIESIPMGNEDALQAKVDALVELVGVQKNWLEFLECKTDFPRMDDARAKCRALGLEV